MAIVTTYVCDVSGASGTNVQDFIIVKIHSSVAPGGYDHRNNMIERLIHINVAKKLSLLKLSASAMVEPVPEVTFESKLKALLQDWVGDLVQTEVENRA